MSIAPEIHEHRLLLHDVPWEAYQSLRAANPTGHLRMTYNRGELEIMSPSRKHAKVSYLLGRMIDEWTILHQIAVEAGRNATFSRQDLQKGLEPDNCYWIAHQAAIRDKEEIDLTIDPPPDLAVEVDVTRSSLSKLPIYQALGVPEVWRWRAGILEVLSLQEGGNYVAQQGSEALPHFPLLLAEEVLESTREDNTTIMLRFRKAISHLP
jgi:Uma2 family endonuclease